MKKTKTRRKKIKNGYHILFGFMVLVFVAMVFIAATIVRVKGFEDIQAVSDWIFAHWPYIVGGGVAAGLVLITDGFNRIIK